MTDLSISIVRHGLTLLREDVPRGAGGFPAQADPTSLTVRDLDGDGEPEVTLLLNTRGTHCCAWSRVYRYMPARAGYSPVEHRWHEDSAQPRIKDLDRDGRPEFASKDARFWAVFGSMSAMPLQISSYRHGRFDDVTRHFQRRIRRHAASLWRFYRLNTAAARLIFRRRSPTSAGSAARASRTGCSSENGSAARSTGTPACTAHAIHTRTSER